MYALGSLYWTPLNRDSTTQGAIIQAIATIVGAMFVIIAAIIQATAIDRQVNVEKNEKLRIEQLNYLGWISIAVQDLKRNAAEDKLKSETFNNLISNDPLLEIIRPHINRLDYYHPKLFLIGADARQYYAMLPYKIVKYLQDNEGTYHSIYEGLQSLKSELLRPSPQQTEITRHTNQIAQGYTELLKNYSDGFDLVTPHIQNVRERLKDNFMEY